MFSENEEASKFADKVMISIFFRCYILTQGPLKETTWHFWYMAYQTRSTAIVMLCKLTENGFCKCSRYWPDSTNPEDIARDENTGLEVSLLSEEVKIFKIRMGKFLVC
jgi:tyrosine-protein phosphatase non-receptor type 1